MTSRNIIRIAASLLFSTIVVGCATSETFEKSFDYGGQQTTTAVLSAPNISAPHSPPIIVGVAYLEVYDNDIFCQKEKALFGETFKKGEPVGRLYVHKKQKIEHGEIPVGRIIVKAGFRAGSFGDESFKCGNYFSFEAKAGLQYEVEVTESRPLVTHCYISIKAKDASGNYTELTDFAAGKKRVIRDDDLSEVCNE